MEPCDGEIPVKRPKLSDGGCGGGGGEDRLSALSDDVLIHILLKLQDAAVAGRTSVLSTRWRRLWTLLPRLRFRCSAAPIGIRSALESHQAPALHRLDVTVMDATAASVEAWLQIASRRLSGDLVLLIKTTQQNETVGEAVEVVTLELPCFENATSIRLRLGYLGLAVAPLGVFARLTDLFLACIKLHGPCMLGDAVSSRRCPALQTLTVDNAWGMRNFAIQSDSLLAIELKDLHPDDALGLGNFTIHSKSLLLISLKNLHGMQQLNVLAPALKDLNVDSCFASSHNQPVANINAPKLTTLRWIDAYDPSSTQLGNIGNLEYLVTYPFLVYGRYGAQLRNSSCVRLLQCFELIGSLTLILVYLPEYRGLPDITSLIEDITRLPVSTSLSLNINPYGHSFGASIFHVLRMCTGVRKLRLIVSAVSHPEAQTVCPLGCICDQQPNWKTEELALNRLQEVEIRRLGGTEHEAALIKRLFDWATVVQKMTITFHCSVAESKGKEFFKMFQSFSSPGICMEGPYFA